MYEATVPTRVVSTGAAATAVSAYTPASGVRTRYAANHPLPPGASRPAISARYRPLDARRSRTTGMLVRVAASPDTAMTSGAESFPVPATRLAPPPTPTPSAQSPKGSGTRWRGR
ncbi:hypothetical protein [Streptomyces sp. 11x1]|uniref:hypothetical protein n=1 Tax=Streptomyces sp. 11x1 TaxID=3038642 RepID=UPI0029315CA3|nr:hypothetical protein [Streptomyces sp. 11x1]WNZ14237.1 hypothetical protein P8T65_46245 [Streptomyces sp. 11x1]